MKKSTPIPKPVLPSGQRQIDEKMKTYNVRIPGMKSVDVVVAVNFGVSTSGALVFKGRGDCAVKAYNKDEWFEVWEV